MTPNDSSAHQRERLADWEVTSAMARNRVADVPAGNDATVVHVPDESPDGLRFAARVFDVHALDGHGEGRRVRAAAAVRSSVCHEADTTIA